MSLCQEFEPGVSGLGAHILILCCPVLPLTFFFFFFSTLFGLVMYILKRMSLCGFHILLAHYVKVSLVKTREKNAELKWP
jgi:hypothetical protein